MGNSETIIKNQQDFDYKVNNTLIKGSINYKRKDNQIMPTENGDFNKYFRDSEIYSKNIYFADIKISTLDSTHIIYKVDKLTNFIKYFDQLSLATVDSLSGLIKSRPIYVHDRIQDLYVYLLTHYDSDIFSNIKKNSRVNLAIKKEDSKCLNWRSICKNADIITDSRMVASLWSLAVKNWLNNLEDGLNNCTENDPRLTCIFIEASTIDYFIINGQQQSVGPLEKFKNTIINSKKANYFLIKLVIYQKMKLMTMLQIAASSNIISIY